MLILIGFFLSHRLPIAIKAINQGYEVHLATSISSKLDVLKSHGLIVHPMNLNRSKSSLFTIFYEFKQIYSIIKSISPNLIHLVTIKPVLLGGLASRILKINAVVYAVSGLGFVFINQGYKAELFKKITKLLYRVALKHKNKIVIFQNADDQKFVSKFARISQKDTKLILGSGVDLNYFTSKALESKMPKILIASRLLNDKGILEFVKAAKIVNESSFRARFVIAGDIDVYNPASIQKSEIDQWKIESSVEFLGHIKNMKKLITSSSIVVLPSYREGFPKILIEAAACGRPVITSDVPGCRDAIENNKTGLLVPVRNAKELAKKIIYLLDNPLISRAMGKAGRKRAENLFDINIVVDKHLKIYSALLANSENGELL